MTFGDMLREKRKEHNLTQEDVAKAVGVTKPTVSRWESGDTRKMKNSTIKKLSNVLQIDIQMFIEHEDVFLPEEISVIRAYRIADEGTKAAIRKLLEIKL